MFQLFNNTDKNLNILIKMCGFTRLQDIQSAIENNVNALGFVFYAKSQRYIELEQAKILIKKIPHNIQIVALFVNETQENIAHICKNLKIDLVQFHGDLEIETPDWCKKCSDFINKPYIKAVGIDKNLNAEFINNVYNLYMQKGASGILLDAKTSSYGGSGIRFDWNIIPKNLLLNDNPHSKPKIILSGGINIDNLNQALKLKPYAIDLSSAIENDIKGIKDAQKIQHIMHIIQTMNSKIITNK